MAEHRSGRLRPFAAAAPLGAIGVVLGVGYLSYADLPSVPVPSENPITEPKRVLGKILFWDEQLSASGVVSCGTCHQARTGGADPRAPGVHPGVDEVFGTPDDALGSPGVIRSTSDGDYLLDPLFGTTRQVTNRSANSMINAAYAFDLFWDGRADTVFIDPQTGETVISVRAGLESQAAMPIVSSVEMAHDGFAWDDVVAKLADARPLELASELPADVDAALASNPSYADLFAAAFGDGTITARRIAFAIATYERTLISDQTPYDAFLDGDLSALTPGQQAGLNAFQASNCIACHVTGDDQFTDHSFRNIGLRPVSDDIGRQAVTGNARDAGRFKVPSLRNVGLKRTFMHNGMFDRLPDVVAFYAQAPGAPQRFQDNLDPVLATVNVPAQVVPAMVDFLQNGLTDPRVRDETFPFDKPTLVTQRPEDRPTFVGGGTAGTGGVIPAIVADAASMLGSAYRTGVSGALAGATAQLWTSFTPPSGGVIAQGRLAGEATIGSDGVATVHWELDPRVFSNGDHVFLQWRVADAGAAGGVAHSRVARVPIFCGRSGCPCPADLTGEGALNTNDFFAFLSAYQSQDDAADFTVDGAINTNDFFAFLAAYQSGC